MSKKKISYQKTREHLEELLEQINSTVSFEQKEALYIEALEELKSLELYLSNQQEILTTIINQDDE